MDILLEKLFSTTLIAIALFLAALALLGISRLFKRKSNIKMGGCGRDPNKKHSKECGNQIHCSLCDEQEKPDLPEDNADTLQKK